MNGWTRERSTATKITRKLIIFFCYKFLWDFTCIASVCVYVCVRLNVFVNRFYFCLFFFRLSTLDFRCSCCFSFVVVAIRSILLEINGKYHNFQKNTRILKINQQRILKYFFLFLFILYFCSITKQARTEELLILLSNPKEMLIIFFHLLLIYFNYVHIFILLYTHLYIVGSVLLAERNWNFFRFNFFLFYYYC